MNYRINGHRVGFVQALNGVYRVIFERCYEENTLEAVEAIDWQNVTVEQVRTDYPACPLPEGYTFSVQEIEYTKQGYFTVILKTDKDTQLTESEESLAAANAQLAELEATYDAN